MTGTRRKGDTTAADAKAEGEEGEGKSYLITRCRYLIRLISLKYLAQDDALDSGEIGSCASNFIGDSNIMRAKDQG